MRKGKNELDTKNGFCNVIGTTKSGHDLFIYNTLNTSGNNLILYSPDMIILQKCTDSLCEEIINRFDIANKLVIVSTGHTIAEPGSYEAKLNSDERNNTVVKFTKLANLPEIYTQIISDTNKFPTSIIFDNVNDLEDLETIIENAYTFEDHFKYVVMTTSSPTVFLNVRERKYFFSPVFYGIRKIEDYFRKYKDTIELVEYKSMSDEFYLDSPNDMKIPNNKFSTLSQFVNDLRMANISSDMFEGDLSLLRSLGDRIMFLLINGVYDSKFVIDIIMRNAKFEFIRRHLDHLEYRSDKLTKFLDIVKVKPSTEMFVIVKKNSLIRILSSIIDFYYPNCQTIKYEGGSIKIKLGRNDKDSSLVIMDINEYTMTRTQPSHSLFFDFVQMSISNHTTVFVTFKEKEYLLNEAVKEQELFKNESLSNEVVKVISTESTSDNWNTNGENVKSNDVIIRIHSDSDVSLDILKDITTELNFIVKDISLQPPTLMLHKNHNLSYLGVRLANFLPYAIEVVNLKSNIKKISILGESIVFGTLTTFNTFHDPYAIEKNTFLLLKNDVILLYCINDLNLIKIKIPTACMEKYILIDKIGLIIEVYFCIGRRPKIYTTDLSNTKIEKLLSMFRTNERFEFLESVQWNRVSLNEVPFIETRNDIKIRINLKNNPDQQKLKSHLINRIKKNSRSRDQANLVPKFEIYDLIDVFVAAFCGYPGVQVLFSRIKREPPAALSTFQILEQFKGEEFSDYYFVVCLLSQKGRYFSYNLDLEDCNKIKMNVKGMIMTLLNRVNTRFMNIKKIIDQSQDRKFIVEQSSHLMRHVIVTPLSIVYKLPISFDGNRVLREFDHEKFLRISLREEDITSKVKDSVIKNQNMIYDYYRKILNDGIFIGERKYFFLAMTMSQMRLHSAWFVTPYFHKSLLIGPDYIRNWLGDFSEIKNIGKYAIRLGQALSSTTATINIEKYVEINDIERNEYVFSDGIGLISFSAAKEVSKFLRLDYIPSAFQIRYAGFKGVVCVHPIVDQDKNFVKDLNFHECKARLLNNLEVNHIDNKIEDDTKRIKTIGLNELSTDLLIRPSMKKFISNHRNVEVVAYASCQPCYLNRQYIMLLEGLGVDISVFLEFHDNYLFSHLTDIYERPNEYIKKHFGLFSTKFNLQNSKIYKKLIMAIFNKYIVDFYKKNRILVKKGCVLMGGLDELGVLEKDEVYLRVRKDSVAHNEGFIVEDNYVIVVGSVLIMKNPCLHPGDIRIVRAVNKPELRYMRDVLVFNQKGSRPLPNMCSGSDLDGDMYTIIWESALLPKKSYPPSEYTGLIVLNKEIVSSSDIVNFYIRYIRNYHLGSIAHAHLVQCDENSIEHENSIFLAELFNRSIDFPKTGFMAVVPETLMPQRYPDFMESKFNSYPSLKTVGVLFRRGYDSQIVKSFRCECKKCIEKYIGNLSFPLKSILSSSNISHKESMNNPSISPKSLDVFNSYKRDITGLIEKHGFQKEELAFLNFAEEEGTSEEILVDLKNLFRRYRSIINDESVNQNELFKLSEECQESINSLPIVLHNTFVSKEKIILKPFRSHKLLENRFILNSSIVIEFFEEKNVEVESPGKNEAKVEKQLYSSFVKNVTDANHRILKEIFDLLFVGKFFDTKSFDLVCLFFNYLFGKFHNEEIDELKACKVLLEISREFYLKAATLPFCHFANREILSTSSNTTTRSIYRASQHTKNLFHIRQRYVDNNDKVKIVIDNLARIISTAATLLILRLNTIEKALHMFYSKKITKTVKCDELKLGRKKVESYSHFIIKGMFDNSDELKLETYKGLCKKGHEGVPLYVPKLLNKGFCDGETYKDNFREFFMNIFLGGTPDLTPKDRHLGIFLQLMVTPGRFYFHNVNPLSINTILTVEKLKSKTIFYKGELVERNALKSYFYNYLMIFDKNLRQNYIKDKGIVFGPKTYEYIFAFVRENVRYQVYFDKKGDEFIPIRISKNKKLKGKAFLIEDDVTNLSNDVQFEIAYEEIILEKDKNIFDEHEKSFLSGDIFTIKNGSYVVSDLLYGSKQFRFEINTMLNIKDSESNEMYPFTLSSREVYTPGKTPLVLNCKSTRLASYSLITRVYKNKKDLKHFIEDFDIAWNCYKKYYS